MRSISRWSGRAPYSGWKPCASSCSITASSISTSRLRRTMPSRISSLPSSRRVISRMASSVSGRKATIRSIRLKNSGRKNCSACLVKCVRSRSSRRRIAIRLRLAEPDRLHLAPAGTQVRGHDNDRIAEVGAAAAGIGQPALAQHAQQRVEHLAVRLLQLVEQHHAKRLLAHAAGQLALAVGLPGRRQSVAAAHRPRHTRSCRSGSYGRARRTEIQPALSPTQSLPTPVGPTKKKLPSGFCGSFRLALITVIRSTSASTASGWPSRRSSK